MPYHTMLRSEKEKHTFLNVMLLLYHKLRSLDLTWAVKRDLVSHMSRSVRANGLELLYEGLNIVECLPRSKL